jgi:hypothetical protein
MESSLEKSDFRIIALFGRSTRGMPDGHRPGPSVGTLMLLAGNQSMDWIDPDERLPNGTFVANEKNFIFCIMCENRMLKYPIILLRSGVELS